MQLVSTVSVILTTCNRPVYLDEALRSIRAQTYENFELLVCDDASDPPTTAVVSRHAGEDDRLIHRRSVHRQGVLQTVLGGLEEAHGDLVTICNDDDAWEPMFLERTTKAFQAHPETVVAFSDHFIMDEGGRIDLAATDENTRRWKRNTLAAGCHQPFAHLAVIDQSIPMVMSAVFRASALDATDFPVQVAGHYDLWLAYLLARSGGAAWYLPDRLTRYRVHSGSATSKGDLVLAQSQAYIWDRLTKDDRLVDIRPELQTKLSQALASLGVRLLREAQRKEARRAFHRSLKHKPTWVSAAGWALSALPTSVARRAASFRRLIRA